MRNSVTRVMSVAIGVAARSMIGCSTPPPPVAQAAAGPSLQSYFDNTGRDDVLSGGARMTPITTPKGTFKVWTKRVGNNPKVKVLLLHGGPGVSHEVYEVFDSHFPAAGIEYYY